MNKTAFIFCRCCMVLLVFISLISSAQLPNNENKSSGYRMISWNFQQGLLYGRTTSFVKDKNGFLWIGTVNGLNRFDGSGFKNYFSNQSGNQSIISNQVLSLVQDSLNNIWIGTDKGLSLYNSQADSFSNFLPDPGASFEFKDIIPFWATSDEVFCVESDSLFVSYNVHSYVKKKLAALPGKFEHREAIGLSIYESKTNAVWLVPASGSLSARSGLFRFSLSTGKLELFDWPCFRHIPNHWHLTEGICYDRKRNSIWLNSEEGLMQLTLNDKKYQYVSALKNIFNRGVGIQMDTKNRVWVGTGNKGIIVYDPDSVSFEKPFAADSALSAKMNNFNYRILCDREGIVWIGYWIGSPMGINQLIPMSKSIYQYPGDTRKRNSLRTSYGFAMDNDGDKVWIFGRDGLDVFDPAQESFKQIGPGDFLSPDKNKQIFFLTANKGPNKGLFSVEQNGGLYEMDLSTKKYKPLTLTDKSNHPILNLRMSSVATPLNKHELIISNENDSLVFILNKDSTTAHLLVDAGDSAISDIVTDDDHLIFLKRKKAEGSSTYSFAKGKLFRIGCPLDTLQWNNIVTDPADHSYWVALPGALVHYDQHFGPIHRYTRNDGIPLVNVWGIKPDGRGNIWFNTETSIARLNPATGKITTISEKDGWHEHGFKTSTVVVQDTKGDLYFFGYGSLDRVSPTKFIETYPPPSIYLKSIEINQQPFPLSTGANNLTALSLTYAQNRISINIGIIDFFSGGKSQIRYKLGEHGNWQYGPSDYSIYYESLPPCQYKLIMQASNASGAYTGPERVLLIDINPPWWKRTWSYAIFVLAFVASLWAFIRYRSRALKEKNIALEEKVIHRTKELKHSLEDLRETQTQLIQREKMASLGELTAGIAHEIQNPLNFVNNFSEVNGELIDEMNQALNQGNVAEARAIAHDIKNNLEKVIHHGKRADGIVKGMLLHSRASTGQKELTDINALADEYLRLGYQGLRAKDKSFTASIRTNFDESIGKISILPQDIGRVLLNLFNNAFYSVTEKAKQQPRSLPSDLSIQPLKKEEYDPIVSVTTKKLNDGVEIRVRDNGMGIPKKIIDKIYQPFFTTKPTGEGTGLGLSLSYDIITKAHGGKLTVETDEGEYSEFIICLAF
ncbi:MAG TPA: ATP-binding protein [Puia sp.]|nr:ATP-binding protein [Puia sp.]